MGNGTPWDLMDPPSIGRPSVNQITLSPDIAMAAGEYEVIIKKAV